MRFLNIKYTILGFCLVLSLNLNANSLLENNTFAKYKRKQSPQLLLGLGASSFLGDLGGKATIGTNDFSDIDIPTTRYVLSAGIRVPLSPTFALRAIGAYTRLKGSDNYTKNRERSGRNLDFTSPLMEGSLSLEISPGKGPANTRRVYFYGGIGYATFNPYTTLNGNKIYLQPLGTEGQNYISGKAKYDLNTIIYPFGIGYRVPAGSGMFSFELAMRKSMTDYIDDVSTTFADPALVAASAPATQQANAQILANRSTSTIPGFSTPGAIRGDSRNNDNYFFIMVYYHVPLGAKGNGGGFGSAAGRRSGISGKHKCISF